LSRLIRAIKQRFPQAAIAVRGDAGFCVPRMLEALERLDQELGEIYFLLGIAKNAVLCRKAGDAMAWAEELQRQLGRTVQRFHEFSYAAGSWKRERRIVAKAEHSAKGPNPRFVITNIEGFDPETLYRAYCQRGQCENWIKDFKNALQADRLSCSTFRANFFRLLLHLAAYRLLHALRLEVARESAELGKAQFDTLRLRLLKVAALVSQSVRRIWVRLPRAFPFAEVFRRLAAGLAIPPAPA
jgi:hypothetical protein